MAKRFSGDFSPDAKTPTAAPKTVKPAKGFRAGLMFYLPLPLLFTAFGAMRRAETGAMVLDLAAFVLLILAAWLLRDGLRAEAEYNARSRASRPALPRKIIAADLAGAGVFLAALSGGMIFAIVLGAVVAVLHLIAFGLDPLKSKGLGGADNIDARRAAKVLAEAEDEVKGLQEISSRLKDREVSERLDGFVNSVRAMIRTIEEDPRDLVQARKYLSVYLKGGREAAAKYEALQAKHPAPEARADLISLIDDLSASFTAERAEMLLDDRADLDVEISVLQERLAYERPDRKGNET